MKNLSGGSEGVLSTRTGLTTSGWKLVLVSGRHNKVSMPLLPTFSAQSSPELQSMSEVGSKLFTRLLGLFHRLWSDIRHQNLPDISRVSQYLPGVTFIAASGTSQQGPGAISHLVRSSHDYIACAYTHKLAGPHNAQTQWSNVGKEWATLSCVLNRSTYNYDD